MKQTDIELAGKLPRNHGIPPLYKLRWRFEYHNGRVDRVGCWNGTDVDANKHNYQPKDGLLWATCEGEKIGAWTIKPFVRVNGQDYFTIRWFAATTAPTFLGDSRDSYKLRPDILGLCIYTRYNVYTTLVDGRVFKRKIKQEELGLKLAEHSLGGQHANH
jgi:hypothetical protein